jgi:hypothetical protein
MDLLVRTTISATEADGLETGPLAVTAGIGLSTAVRARAPLRAPAAGREGGPNGPALPFRARPETPLLEGNFARALKSVHWA